MEKRLLQLFGLILVVAFAWHFWNPFWRSDLTTAADPASSEKIVFSIEKGSSAKTIAKDLYAEDLIVNKLSFTRAVETENLDGSLRYGSFVLSPSMTLEEIVTVLTTQGTGELALTVPEGWTIAQIDARLTEMALIQAGDFEDCTRTCNFSYSFLPKEDAHLEGYLFPDTYFIDSASFTSKTLIQQMLNNFDQKWSDAMQSSLEKSGRSLQEVVTMASLLEREVRTPKDLPIVSGIIWKRLDNDWYLGIDATLLYKDDDGTLSSEDLTKDSPYNTRTSKGLPPTAIGNPGLETLEAALTPESSEYWFYLTDSEGNVHYATTNAEHEANKAEYL